jgi:NADPH:quinone reductase
LPGDIYYCVAADPVSYLAERSERDALVLALFDALRRGILTIKVGKSVPLARAGAAHEELESRRATGPVILVT